MTSDIFDNEQMKSALKENVLELGNLNVEFVFDDRSEILSKMTRVLEQRLIVYLEQTKMKLRDYSRHHNVRLRLREVKAILRRLKQAACYPEPFKDEEEEEDPQEKEVEEILKRLRIYNEIIFISFLTNSFFLNLKPMRVLSDDKSLNVLIYLLTSFI